MNVADFVKRFNENAFSIDELVNMKGVPKDVVGIIHENELLRIKGEKSENQLDGIDCLIEMTDISEKTVGKIDFVPPYNTLSGSIVFGVIEDVYYLLFNKTQILMSEEDKEDALFICLNDASFVSFLLDYYVFYMSNERGVSKPTIEINKFCGLIGLSSDCFFIDLIMKNK